MSNIDELGYDTRQSRGRKGDLETAELDDLLLEDGALFGDEELLDLSGFQIESESDSKNLGDKVIEEDDNSPFHDAHGAQVINELVNTAVESGNESLVALTAFGRDVQGKFSNEAIFSNLVSTQTSSEDEKYKPRMETITDSSGEISFKVAREFDANEVKNLETLIMNCATGKEKDKRKQKSPEQNDKLAQISKQIVEIKIKMRGLEKELAELEPLYLMYKDRYNIIRKSDEGEVLAKRELDEYLRMDEGKRAENVRQYNAHEKRLESLLFNINNHKSSLEKAYALQKEIQAPLVNRNHILEVSAVEERVKRVLLNMTKVVAVQLGFGLRDNSFREDVIGITCSCGHTGVYNSQSLPKFISGDISNDFKTRSRLVSEKTKNYFDNTSQGEREMRWTLTEANQEKYMASRLQIPGVTNEGEALVCDSCEKYMLFAPEVYESMAERSNLQDMWIYEFHKSKEGRNVEISNPVTIYLSENNLNSAYLADLGLGEYKNSKVAPISSNIHAVDNNGPVKLTARTSLLSEEYLREYSSMNGLDVDLSVVENMLLNKAISLKNKLAEELQLANRIVNSTATSTSKTRLEKATIKANFINTYRSIILEWAFHNNFTSSQMRVNLLERIERPTEFAREITRFTISNSLDAIIEGKSIIVFDNGRLTSISNKSNPNLPHVQFIKCYKDVILEFLMNIHRKANREAVKTNLHLVNSIFYDVQRIGQAVRDVEEKSDSLVIRLINVMKDEYFTRRALAFENFTKTPSFSAITAKNVVPNWVFYEMISQGLTSYGYPEDQDKFESLYSPLLKKEGLGYE